MLRRNTIATRAKIILNLERFNACNEPEMVSVNNVVFNKGNINILRMPLKRYNDDKVYLPDIFGKDSYDAIMTLIRRAISYQRTDVRIEHPFMYLTIRKGKEIHKNNDVWHVDGFSTRYNHVPEQNYIWSDVDPTEYAVQKIKFPKGFNSLYNNVHLFIQDRIKLSHIKKLKTNTLYCIDPYVIHRRPFIPDDIYYYSRTFVRISFTPIEIQDVNNTRNPILDELGPIVRDGVKDFRDKLTKF